MGKRGNKCKNKRTNKEIKFKMLSEHSPDPALLQIAGHLDTSSSNDLGAIHKWCRNIEQPTVTYKADESWRGGTKGHQKR